MISFTWRTVFHFFTLFYLLYGVFPWGHVTYELYLLGGLNDD